MPKTIMDIISKEAESMISEDTMKNIVGKPVVSVTSGRKFGVAEGMDQARIYFTNGRTLHCILWMNYYVQEDKK